LRVSTARARELEAMVSVPDSVYDIVCLAVVPGYTLRPLASQAANGGRLRGPIITAWRNGTLRWWGRWRLGAPTVFRSSETQRLRIEVRHAHPEQAARIPIWTRICDATAEHGQGQSERNHERFHDMLPFLSRFRGSWNVGRVGFPGCELVHT